MLASIARRSTLVSLPKVGVRAALASLILLSGGAAVKDATASNETRTLSFHHTHSGEDLTVTFKRNGRYDEEALKKLNYFLRDWRSQDETTMDRRLFDIVWEVYRDVDGKQPIQIISSYRAPATNSMLRRRSSGVARSSLHMRGQAMDFFIPGVALADIRAAGLRLQRGGVGFYPTSGSPFVHLDTGSIRHWPRMSHDQLARLFPDGRTVYIPSDGKPLPGYQLAMADIERRGNGKVDASEGKAGNFLSKLFGKKSNDEDEEEGPAEAAPAETKAVAVRTEPTPLPRSRPAGATQQATYQVAAATTTEVPAPPRNAKADAAANRPENRPENRPMTPADIINARGFWTDEPAPAKPQPATAAARRAIVADLLPTASLPAANDAPASTTTSNAMAYAPPAAFLDRSTVVAATGPVAARKRTQPAAAGDAPQTAKVAAVGPVLGPWLKAMILSPSATTSMAATAFGESDLRAVKPLLAKPERAVAMTFSDDPQLGMSSDCFSGPAVASLPMVSFVTRTALLR